MNAQGDRRVRLQGGTQRAEPFRLQASSPGTASWILGLIVLPAWFLGGMFLLSWPIAGVGLLAGLIGIGIAARRDDVPMGPALLGIGLCLLDLVMVARLLSA